MERVSPLTAQRYLPRVIPHPWRVVDEGPDGFRALNPGLRSVLIVSVELHDGQPWLHASMSVADRVPTWDELERMKRWVCGTERIAYQVHPPMSEYVNDHPHVLHLWCPLEHRPTPDFRRGGTI